MNNDSRMPPRDDSGRVRQGDIPGVPGIGVSMAASTERDLAARGGRYGTADGESIYGGAWGWSGANDKHRH